MADDEDIAALVVDNGSGMCKGKFFRRTQRNFNNLQISVINDGVN